MQIDELREYCLALPGVTEGFPFGESALVFKVMDKMFLLAAIDSIPLTANMKCEPERAIELREQYSAIQPGYHMNKKHWNTITLEELDDSLIRELINHSYALVVNGLSVKQKAELAKLQ